MRKTVSPGLENRSIIERVVAKHLDSPGELGDLSRQLKAAAARGAQALAVAHSKMWANPTYQQAYREEVELEVVQASKPIGTAVLAKEETSAETGVVPNEPAASMAAASRKEVAKKQAENGAMQHPAAKNLILEIRCRFDALETGMPGLGDPAQAGITRLLSFGAFGGPWIPEPADYLAALNLLRRSGWVFAQKVAWGFAQHHHERREVATARFETALENFEAFAAIGVTALRQESAELDEWGDVNGYEIDPRKAPDPNAPYVGESKDRTDLGPIFDQILWTRTAVGNAIDAYNRMLRGAASRERAEARKVRLHDDESASPEPDWKFWTLMGGVKLWQAAALLVRLDPDSLVPRMSGEFEGGTTAFFQMLRLMCSNIAEMKTTSLSLSGTAEYTLKLSEACRWATTKGFQVPPEFVDLIASEAAPATAGGDRDPQYAYGWEEICDEWDTAGGRRLGKDRQKTLRELLKKEIPPVEPENIDGRARGRVRLLRETIRKVATKDSAD